MNYLELRTAIQDTAENDETRFVANIPFFIRRAEQEIFYGTQLPLFRAEFTSTVSAGSRTLTVPTDFKAPLSLRVVNGEFLINKDVNFIDEAYPSSAQGVPRYYALSNDSTISLTPLPETDTSMLLRYAREPASLTVGADDGTTWLSLNAQNAMIYGAIWQGYIFMKGEQDLIEEYKGKFWTAVRALKNLGEGRDRKDVYRGGERRSQVE